MPTNPKTLFMEPDTAGRYVLRPGTLVEQQVQSLRELLEARLDGIDEATKLVRSDLIRVPSEVDIKVGALDREVQAKLLIISEKFATVAQQFATIQTQFKERDIRVDENKAAAAKGVEAAFAASEKVGAEQNRNFTNTIEKSERVTGKTIDQISVQLGTVQKSLDDKIGDLRETVTRMDAARGGRREVSGPLWAVVGAVVAALLTAVILSLTRPPPSPVVPVLPVTPSLNQPAR